MCWSCYCVCIAKYTQTSAREDKQFWYARLLLGTLQIVHGWVYCLYTEISTHAHMHNSTMYMCNKSNNIYVYLVYPDSFRCEYIIIITLYILTIAIWLFIVVLVYTCMVLLNFDGTFLTVQRHTWCHGSSNLQAAIWKIVLPSDCVDQTNVYYWWVNVYIIIGCVVCITCTGRTSSA